MKPNIVKGANSRTEALRFALITTDIGVVDEVPTVPNRQGLYTTLVL